MMLSNKQQPPRWLKKLINNFKKLFLITGFITLLLISFLVLENKLFFKSKTALSLSESLFQAVGHEAFAVNSFGELTDFATRGVKGFFQEDFPTMDLSVKQEGIILLHQSLQDTGKTSTVPAKIMFNGQSLNAKIRSKGDRAIHRENFENMSFRVNLKGTQTFEGLDKFSIQKPVIRNYTWEHLFHEIAKSEGILTLDQGFVELSFNGNRRGLYTYEEVPDKATIERNNRKYGPIFGLDEDLGFKYPNIYYEVYDSEYWLSDGIDTHKYSLNILNSIKELSIDNDPLAIELVKKYFDIDMWAKFFALSDIFGAYHGTYAKSSRIYYNPTSGLFEPLIFDAHIGAADFEDFFLFDFLDSELLNRPSPKCKIICFDAKWFRLFFNNDNPEFLKEYRKQLNLYSTENFISNIFDIYNQNFYNIDNKLYSKFSPSDYIFARGLSLYHFNLNHLRDRKTFIDKRLARLDQLFVPNYKPEIFISSQNSKSSLFELYDFKYIGSSLEFSKEEILVLTGNSSFVGNSDSDPLIVKGPAMIVQLGGTMHIENVIFEGLKSFPVDGKNWTGGINLINSKNHLSNVVFNNIDAEDSINIVNGDSILSSDIVVKNAKSDAIDIDFGKFSAANLYCYEIGNDCFDSSSAQILIKKVEATNVKDKLISAGENSSVEILEVIGKDIAIGVVSKDSSNLEIKNLNLTNVELYGAVFTKKTMFDQAFMKIGSIEQNSSDNYIFLVNNRDSIEVKESSMNVFKELSSEEIEDLMYGKVYGKATERQ